MPDNLKAETVIYHMCLVPVKPKTWVGIWTPQVRLLNLIPDSNANEPSQVIYGIFVIVMTFLNAADRPRNVTVKIVEDLWRDGVIFHVVRAVCVFGLLVDLIFPSHRRYWVRRTRLSLFSGFLTLICIPALRILNLSFGTIQNVSFHFRLPVYRPLLTGPICISTGSS